MELKQIEDCLPLPALISRIIWNGGECVFQQTGHGPDSSPPGAGCRLSFSCFLSQLACFGLYGSPAARTLPPLCLLWQHSVTELFITTPKPTVLEKLPNWISPGMLPSLPGSCSATENQPASLAYAFYSGIHVLRATFIAICFIIVPSLQLVIHCYISIFRILSVFHAHGSLFLSLILNLGSEKQVYHTILLMMTQSFSAFFLFTCN